MKYIRTKDGVWQFIEEYESVLGDKYVSVVWADSFRGEKVFEKEEIVKQADTIEELCDEFVYAPSKEDRPILVYKPSVFHKLSDELYGAIWTDKGLIFVAKMNDKGELELL